MKQFTYTITDPVGIHARPAGLLAKAAKALDSTVTITKGEKSAAATTVAPTGVDQAKDTVSPAQKHPTDVTAAQRVTPRKL